MSKKRQNKGKKGGNQPESLNVPLTQSQYTPEPFVAASQAPPQIYPQFESQQQHQYQQHQQQQQQQPQQQHYFPPYSNPLPGAHAQVPVGGAAQLDRNPFPDVETQQEVYKNQARNFSQNQPPPNPILLSTQNNSQPGVQPRPAQQPNNPLQKGPAPPNPLKVEDTRSTPANTAQPPIAVQPYVYNSANQAWQSQPTNVQNPMYCSDYHPPPPPQQTAHYAQQQPQHQYYPQSAPPQNYQQFEVSAPHRHDDEDEEQEGFQLNAQQKQIMFCLAIGCFLIAIIYMTGRG